MDIQLAHSCLKKSFFCGVAAFFIIPLLISTGMPFSLLISLVAISLALFHVFLGMAASASGRSWVSFGLLPALWPGVGGLISSSILFFSLRKAAKNSGTVKNPWVSTWPMVMTLVCIVVVAIAVPLVGKKFENWPNFFGSVYLAAAIFLPIFSLVGVFQSAMLLQDGQRKPKTFISLFVCSLGLLAFIAYVAAFTHAP